MRGSVRERARVAYATSHATDVVTKVLRGSSLSPRQTGRGRAAREGATPGPYVYVTCALCRELLLVHMMFDPSWHSPQRPRNR